MDDVVVNGAGVGGRCWRGRRAEERVTVHSIPYPTHSSVLAHQIRTLELERI